MADRSDIRTYVRDYLYEATADLFTDLQVNRAITHTMRELNRKNIYIESLYTDTLSTTSLDYTLPDIVVKIEKVEINMGTDAKPDWKELKGWDQYSNTLYLRSYPTEARTVRIHTKDKFTELTDDVTATDIPDEKLELIALGSSYRCYRMIMGYFLDASNWDSVIKPDGISMNQVVNWIKETRVDYKDLIQTFKTTPRPREINMVD